MRDRRVPRTCRLPLAKLEATKRALGAATATETIERPPDLVVFQQAPIEGTRSGRSIEPTPCLIQCLFRSPSAFSATL